MSEIRVRLREKIEEAESVVRLVLESTSGDSLPPFTPGAHIDVHLPGNVIRQYSLCNEDPSQPHDYQIAVLLAYESRGGSIAIHQLSPGMELTISHPRNHFPLAPHARTLLLAGGIGITPLVPMAHYLHKQGALFELHYSSRAPAAAAFLPQLKHSPFADRVHFYFSSGSSGRLDLQALLSRQPSGTHFYICGPKGYIESAQHALALLEIDPSCIHTESFLPLMVDGNDAEFEIQLASTSQVMCVPADVSVAQVLEQNGIDVALSCEQGICGACLVGVLAGDIVHRDSYLTDAEQQRNNQMALCCSRGTGRLVLDI